VRLFRDQCIDEADLRPYAALVRGNQDPCFVFRFAPGLVVLAAPRIENGLQQRDIFRWYGGRKMLLVISQERQHKAASIASRDLSLAILVKIPVPAKHGLRHGAFRG
jgi:hypothetical protein